MKVEKMSSSYISTEDLDSLQLPTTSLPFQVDRDSRISAASEYAYDAQSSDPSFPFATPSKASSSSTPAAANSISTSLPQSSRALNSSYSERFKRVSFCPLALLISCAADGEQDPIFYSPCCYKRNRPKEVKGRGRAGTDPTPAPSNFSSDRKEVDQTHREESESSGTRGRPRLSMRSYSIDTPSFSSLSISPNSQFYANSKKSTSKALSRAFNSLHTSLSQTLNTPSSQSYFLGSKVCSSGGGRGELNDGWEKDLVEDEDGKSTGSLNGGQCGLWNGRSLCKRGTSKRKSLLELQLEEEEEEERQILALAKSEETKSNGTKESGRKARGLSLTTLPEEGGVAGKSSGITLKLPSLVRGRSNSSTASAATGSFNFPTSVSPGTPETALFSTSPSSLATANLVECKSILKSPSREGCHLFLPPPLNSSTLQGGCDPPPSYTENSDEMTSSLSPRLPNSEAHSTAIPMPLKGYSEEHDRKLILALSLSPRLQHLVPTAVKVTESISDTPNAPSWNASTPLTTKSAKALILSKTSLRADSSQTTPPLKPVSDSQINQALEIVPIRSCCTRCFKAAENPGSEQGCRWSRGAKRLRREEEERLALTSGNGENRSLERTNGKNAQNSAARTELDFSDECDMDEGAFVAKKVKVDELDEFNSQNLDSDEEEKSGATKHEGTDVEDGTQDTLLDPKKLGSNQWSSSTSGGHLDGIPKAQAIVAAKGRPTNDADASSSKVANDQEDQKGPRANLVGKAPLSATDEPKTQKGRLASIRAISHAFGPSFGEPAKPVIQSTYSKPSNSSGRAGGMAANMAFGRGAFV